MRLLLGIVVPFLLQAIGYGLVFVESSRTSSFVGLIAISTLVVTVPALLRVAFLGTRGEWSLKALVLATWAIAIAPPALLLVLNKLVT